MRPAPRTSMTMTLGRVFRLLSWGPPLWAAYTYVGHPSVVMGRSMEPTLRDKRDIVWVSCIGASLGHEPRRGDVVVLTCVPARAVAWNFRGVRPGRRRRD